MSELKQAVPPKLLGSYDYYSPFATAAIVNRKSGKRYPLTAAAVAKNSGVDTTLEVNGVTAGGTQKFTLDFLPFLTQISVHIDAGVVPRITATLNPPLEIARALLAPEVDVFEWGGVSELEVQFGYSAGMGSSNQRAVSPVYRGLIMQPNFSYSGDDFTITFEAQGNGGWLAATTEGGATTKASTFLGIIQELCANLKITLETDLDTGTEELLKRETGKLALGAYSYFSTIYDLARRCGCNVYLRDEAKGTETVSTLTLRSLGKLIKEPPVGTLALLSGLKDTIGPTTGVYPILSVSTDNTAVFLPATTKTMFTGKIGADGKVDPTVVAVETDPIPTSNSGAVGKRDVTTAVTSRPANGAAEGSQDRPKVSVDAAKRAVGAALLKASTENGRIGMKLEIETLGFPDVQPGMNLNVVGMGQRFDGNFIVMEVNHEYSSSGLSTNLTLIANASKIWGALRETFPTLDANSNVAAPPKSQPDGSAGSKAPVVAKPEQGAPQTDLGRQYRSLGR